ncbi:MAG: right-handed parallel beta-helix repeat-containing protein [Roseiflexaceae bacterium]|nr:right-handed parallel beta-helix repeat-containing protein [Roseiflexaceae bacterium]
MTKPPTEQTTRPSAQNPKIQIDYDSQTNTIDVRRGLISSFAVLRQSLAQPDVLREIAPGEWLLAANLQVGKDAELRITAPEVRWLKLRSDAEEFVWVKVRGGILRFDGVCVTSWDGELQDVDKNYADGRSFVLARDGAEMNIRRSELSYLGYEANESYGLAWRLEGTSGEISDSVLGYNFYGLYAHQASGLLVRGNDVHHSVRYGIDPHTASNQLLIEQNRSHHNGKHGIILAEGCSNSIIRSNITYNNTLHGIVMYQHSDNNLIENNQSFANGLEGININNSSGTTIRANTVYGNTKNGVGVGQLATDTMIIENTIYGNQEDGIALYSDATRNIMQGNRISDNLRYGIYIKSIGNQVVGGNRVFKNRIGVYLNVNPAPEVSKSENEIYDNAEGDVLTNAN